MIYSTHCMKGVPLMKSRNILPVLLLTCAILLSGCGAKTEAPAPAEPAAKPEAEVSAPAEDVITLDVGLLGTSIKPVGALVGMQRCL